MTFADLFAGIGGFRLGLERQPYYENKPKTFIDWGY